MNITIEDVIKQVRSGFDPAAQRLGLKGPTLSKENMYFSLGYFDDAIGLEILVELSPFFVLALPFRVVRPGEVPVGYTDSAGRVQKMYLQDALDKLGARYADEETKLKQLGGDYRNCEATVAILASLVETHWAAIREKAEKVLA